ncbi:molybdopterin-dependent oxidoreductase [Actinokineospora diospyrosa]|uniref:Biotin/methionine sulfoxide reductase n=1 Tax=Actinokineospora diospyrosa TaxID=103728 RepID=A0ABT1IMH3_9PSEU|nr:molybdopterin-dependent oxidoreductase [Actinokineospora diospyrosa]MCP2273867.1 biotin/methionine sulfoxide reductase [Actinokineospora diospyrosa]
METSAHWGTYLVEVSADGCEVVGAGSRDPDAAPAIGNVVDGNRHRSRVARPSVRRGWLERGPGPDTSRGGDDYVEVSWDTALDLVAGELERVRSGFGNQAIFGGSYGWGSAGRLHHAQSQLHRFLNTIGGYTRSINDYSRGASMVLLPHLIGAQGALDLRYKPVSWADAAEHTDLLVTFGGVRRSNMWVVPGGHARHVGSGLARAAARTTRVVTLSAQRDDAFADLDAEWIGVMPATDTAVMLALIHVLVVDGLADDEFLARYTVGAEEVRRYVLGSADGVPKTPEWASAISRTPAGVIRELAHRMATGRTLINVVYALQRGERGEQAVFAGLTLAAFLGQIGLPGGGFVHGFGSMGDYGVGVTGPRLPTFPQGYNPVPDYIPCARISDLLLNPGAEIPYNGGTVRFPEVKLAYWAGGNPFHHHQDLRRLREALSTLDTFIVNETHWTPTARHADVVLPAATTLERDDVAAGAGDSRLRAVPRVVPPRGEAREEFWIYSRLAERMGADFAEGLDSWQWLRRIYSESRAEPSFEEFWREGGVDLPQEPYRDTVFTDFRADPVRYPVQTPSGRIELFSAALAGFELADVAGHAQWREPTQWWGAGGEFDLHLLCTQPSHRLHSQLDMGSASQSTKVAGREPLRLHPTDAAARGLADGDLALVRSPQGSLLAGVLTTENILPGVARMHTGAWFDPSAPHIATCINGNVNVLTRDVATSTLTQATSGAHVLVAVTRYDGPVPPVRAYDPPPLSES